MNDLNKHQEGPTVLEQELFDTLTVTNMGDAIALAQVDEEGELHDIIISPQQAERLIATLRGYLA